MWNAWHLCARSAPELPRPMIPTVEPFSSRLCLKSQRPSCCAARKCWPFLAHMSIMNIANSDMGMPPLPLAEVMVTGCSTNSG